MTVKEIAKVMSDQFIAVEVNGKITFSGTASKLKTYAESKEVETIIVPKNEFSATMIITK